MPVSLTFVEPAALVAAVGAGLLAGLGGSGHCALMCGPLAYASGRGASAVERRQSFASWHLGRLLAYVVLGAAVGLLGRAALRRLEGYEPYVAVAVAALMLATAFGLWVWLARRAVPSRISFAATQFAARFSGPVRAAAMGLATPLLPCGLLHGVLLAALATGTPGLGMAFMGAFAVGGIPALSALQWGGASWLSGRPWVHRAVTVVAAAVILWRAYAVPVTGACH